MIVPVALLTACTGMPEINPHSPVFSLFSNLVNPRHLQGAQGSVPGGPDPIIIIVPHSHLQFCWIFKSLARYWKYHVQNILAQNPDHRPINFIMLTHLTTPQEYLQQFSKTSIIMSLIIANQSFARYSNL